MKKFLKIFGFKNKKLSRIENRIADIEVQLNESLLIISKQAEMIAILARIQGDLVSYIHDNEIINDKNKKLSSGIILLETVDDDGVIN